MRQAVITGMGVVSALGVGVSAFWRALVEGRSGIRRISKFDASGFPVQLGAEIPGDQAGGRDRRLALPPEVPPEAVDEPSRFALTAAEMAWADAGLADCAVDGQRVALFLGVSGFHVPDYRALADLAVTIDDGADAADLGHRTERVERGWGSFHGAAITPVLLLGRQLPIRGRVAVISAACAGGAQAIGEAKRCLERGDADIAVAGGAEEGVSPIKLFFFFLLGALSRRHDLGAGALRPFDRYRDGTVLGDGAGMVILETLEHAARRGARVYARLAGYGASSDAYRLTDSRPDGTGAALAMTRALADAGLSPDAVDYVNAHGTGTVANDRAEAVALHRVFGGRAARMPISSTKAATGHLVTAAGAVECIASALSVVHGVIPPTLNCRELDPECDLDCVPHTAREQALAVALSNSFGFGGHNVTLVLRRP
jgi:3-oxoacyl-[acyl-carrier-protein] synthase II